MRGAAVRACYNLQIGTLDREVGLKLVMGRLVTSTSRPVLVVVELDSVLSSQEEVISAMQSLANACELRTVTRLRKFFWNLVRRRSPRTTTLRKKVFFLMRESTIPHILIHSPASYTGQFLTCRSLRNFSCQAGGRSSTTKNFAVMAQPIATVRNYSNVKVSTVM